MNEFESWEGGMPFWIQRKDVYSPTVLAALCGDVFYEFPFPIKQVTLHTNDDRAKKGDLDKQRREESSLNDMEFTTAG